MTFIEGVGDEVIHFFLLLAVAFIALLAWWSTNLSERPLIRTVFIVERRTIRQTPTDTQTITSDVNDTTDVLQEDEIVAESKTSQSGTIENNTVDINIMAQNNLSDEVENSVPSSDLSQDSGNRETDIVEEVNSFEAADESIVRNRRLAFFEAAQEQKSISEKNECIQNVLEESTPQEDSETQNADDGNIRIRLKYLNDDQKLVEGKLQEQLGDFKRRHFSIELAGRKLVRLIFNGQVLQEDSKTLQNCGLFDNCVVHCLVHSRTPPPSPNLNRSRNENHAQNESSQHWDLGSILFASLSLLLGLAWYGRYQYAQLYTATTTVALVGLTGIFTVSLIGMYMPDTDGVRTQS